MRISRNHARLALLMLLVGALGLAAVDRATLDPVMLVDRAHPSPRVAWGAFIFMYALGTVLFVPGSLFGLAGGALFGPVWGSVANLAGALIGASAAFLCARYLAADWVARKSYGWLKQLISGVEEEGWRFVAFVRLVPLFPFNVVNYAFGLTRIPFMHYVAASVFCMLPGVLAYTYLGHAGKEAVAGAEGLVQDVLIALALMATVLFIPRLAKRLRRSSPAIRYTDAVSLRNLLENGKAGMVLDVRGLEEYGGSLGHIAGSLNVPLPELAASLPHLDGNEKGTIVVCRSDKRSAKAAEVLAASGRQNISVLQGGMEQWNRLGFPVER